MPDDVHLLRFDGGATGIAARLESAPLPVEGDRKSVV